MSRTAPFHGLAAGAPGRAGDEETVLTEVEQAQSAPARHGVHVYSIVSVNDADILPHFLQHYRKLGADSFRLCLHGSWPTQSVEALSAKPDIDIFHHTSEPFTEPWRMQVMNQMVTDRIGSWGVFADADELVELPYSSLRRTISVMQVLGIDSLPALLMQRVSADGALPAISPAANLDALFPLIDLHLCEAMGVANPVWKAKYPIARITDRFRFQRGNHLPPNHDAPMTAPIRAVVHHFKWRDVLSRSLRDGRKNANENEQAQYLAYLERHGWRVPTTRALNLRGANLAERGILVRPSRPTLLAYATRRKLKDNPDRVSAEGTRRHRDQVASWAEDTRACELLDPGNLKLQPGSVCLITAEITGPSQTGGIGTAVAAQAELLSSSGHDVHVLFTPFASRGELDQLWVDYWASRGVTLHHLPRRKGQPLPVVDTALLVTEWLRSRSFDLLHFHDSHGLGALAGALKAAGRAFSQTAIVVTEHGSAPWHRRGNWLPMFNDEPEDGFLQEQAIRLSDLAIFPSGYMMNWTRHNMQLSLRASVVLPNTLPGTNRSFSNPKMGPPKLRPVHEIVFFGRLEFRKGLDLFIDAVEQIRNELAPGFQITLIGRLGQSVNEQLIEQRLKQLGVTTKIISNFDTHNAVGYLKTQDCLVVIPSRVDNLPYTAYECLENGIPILATRSGGIVELVDSRDAAFAFAANAVEDLSEALRTKVRAGAPIARLSFDPGAVELASLSLHARLIDDARNGRSAAEVPRTATEEIVYGSADNHNVTIRTFTGRQLSQTASTVGRPVEAATWISEVYTAVEKSAGEIVVLRHIDVQPLPDSMPSLVRLLTNAAADAVVGAYVLQLRNGELGPSLAVLGGPGERGVRWNVFGAGYFAIKRTAFLKAGGFDPSFENPALAHWDLLNRLTAAGATIVSLPVPIAAIQDDPASQALPNPVFDELLLRPWIEATSAPLARLVRLSLARLDAVDPHRLGTDARPLYGRPLPAKSRRKKPAIGLSEREQAALRAALHGLGEHALDLTWARRIAQRKLKWPAVFRSHPLNVGYWRTARRLQRAAIQTSFPRREDANSAIAERELYELVLSLMPRELRTADSILDGEQGAPRWTGAALNNPANVFYWSTLRRLQQPKG